MAVAHETITLREYEEVDRQRCGLDEQGWADLEVFARKNQQDRRGNYRPVPAFGSGRRTLKATNFVGVLSTSRGSHIEILPKIDLAPSGETADANDDAGTGPDAGSAARKPSPMPGAADPPRPGRPDDERTREIFLQMLRAWRGLRHAELPPSAIRSLRRFPMLEVFAHLFLQNLAHLARHGLARRYVRVEDNLPYLRGHLLFQQHVQHYRPVMAWVRLFLFGQGLATFHGKHKNQSFILDAKWKRLKSEAQDGKKRGIVQADMYQLHAYGRRYGCRTVALVYPRTDDFDEPLRFAFYDDLTLLCLPFDVSAPRESVQRCLAALRSPECPAEAWRSAA